MNAAAAARADDLVIRRPQRAWLAARVTALCDLRQPGRVLSALFMLVARLALTYWLWNALYASAGTASTAGMTVRQATTYALLGVLYLYLRASSRFAMRDAVAQHVLEGTIAYWFLRPVSPQRYYLIRAVGDLGYGACRVLCAYAVCLAAGFVDPPVSARAAVAAAITLLLGLTTLYYLQLLVDLACFWLTVNEQLALVVGIVQNLLAGALVPLWFFPTWFVDFDRWLPFQNTLNVPISFYVGRIPPSAFWRDASIQLLWILVLAWWSRDTWRRAQRRVTIAGG